VLVLVLVDERPAAGLHDPMPALAGHVRPSRLLADIGCDDRAYVAGGVEAAFPASYAPLNDLSQIHYALGSRRKAAETIRQSDQTARQPALTIE
jgi:hypothetical protein